MWAKNSASEPNGVVGLCRAFWPWCGSCRDMCRITLGTTSRTQWGTTRFYSIYEFRSRETEATGTDPYQLRIWLTNHIFQQIVDVEVCFYVLLAFRIDYHHIWGFRKVFWLWPLLHTGNCKTGTSSVSKTIHHQRVHICIRSRRILLILEGWVIDSTSSKLIVSSHSEGQDPVGNTLCSPEARNIILLLV